MSSGFTRQQFVEINRGRQLRYKQKQKLNGENGKQKLTAETRRDKLDAASAEARTRSIHHR
jgi:hypothetical protein